MCTAICFVIERNENKYCDHDSFLVICHSKMSGNRFLIAVPIFYAYLVQITNQMYELPIGVLFYFNLEATVISFAS